jgi:uncharacterized membrane protein YqiK
MTTVVMLGALSPVLSLFVLVLPALLLVGPLVLGAVLIQERQVGIVVKRFGTRALPPGHFVALGGEAGYQADTLAPGLHFGYWRWQFRIIKVSVTVVPQGEIALVLAADGAPIPPERILGKVVDCDNFQDARKFLLNGGDKGRQLGILTAGTYRINSALFTVITSASAPEHGMAPEQLLLQRVEPDQVGIATTLDGQPIEAGEIAGPTIPGHDNFQNAQAFIDGGGRRGLQEQILLSGAWNLNPWFAQVEQVPMVQIPIGYVGVVISFVGMAHEDVSGVEFKHGDLVVAGHKGVWVTPLYPGKHPINTRVMKVEPVPTTNIVLNWATRTEAHHYDEKLSSITVRSKDGFAFNLDGAISTKRKTVPSSGGDRHDVGQPKRDGELAGVILAPSDYCSIGLQRQIVSGAGGHRDNVAEARRHIGLAGHSVGDLVLAPGDERAVSL